MLRIVVGFNSEEDVLKVENFSTITGAVGEINSNGGLQQREEEHIQEQSAVNKGNKVIRE